MPADSRTALQTSRAGSLRRLRISFSLLTAQVCNELAAMRSGTSKNLIISLVGSQVTLWYTSAMTDSRNRMPPVVNPWPSPQGYWCEAPGDIPGWHTAAHIVERNGKLVIAELRVYPARKLSTMLTETQATWDGESTSLPEGGFRSPMLRLVRPYRLIEVSQTLFEHLEKVETRDPSARPPVDYRRRPGRPPKPDCWYAQMAAEYADLCHKRVRNPIQVLARKRAQPHSEPRASTQPGEVRRGPAGLDPDPKHFEAIRWQLKEARRRGLLTPSAAPGHAGGTLTDKGRAALNHCKEHKHGTHPKAPERP